MQAYGDSIEAQGLIARYGPTLEREWPLYLDDRGYAYWREATALLRRAEVVMVVRRADGRLLLHTKGHYPPNTFRLPTGGVRRGEAVLDALAREQWEELGLSLEPAAMPGILHYQLYHKSGAIPFASYIFVLELNGDPVLQCHDDSEAITELCWIEPERMPSVATNLRCLRRAWGDWGPFRALTHDLVVEVLQPSPTPQPADPG